MRSRRGSGAPRSRRAEQSEVAEAPRLDRVRELRSLGGGEYRVVLGDGTQVPMSQRYRDRLP
jgi:hypothetical protein